MVILQCMLKISILVPVYGVEKYIEECARSLFEQTYEDIEYVFVDDCSPDRSIAILEQTASEYPNRLSQIKIVRHEKNQGLGGARLTALQNATGDYVAHVDSDDLMPTDAIRELAGIAEKTDADFIDGAYEEWADGKPGKKTLPPHTSKENLLRKMLCQNIVKNRIWGRLYRRTTLLNHNVLSIKGIDYSEDYCVVPRAIYYSTMAHTDNTVYYYRTDNAASYTHTQSERHITSHLRACQLVAQFIAAADNDRKYRRATDIGIANAWRCAADNGYPPEKAEEILQYKQTDIVCRLTTAMWKRRLAIKVATMIYRLYRRMYTTICT